MHRPTLALVVLLALAGCNGFVGGTEPQPTLTPAPVPTDRPPLPPGIDQSGSVTPAAVGTAHSDALAGTSYAVETERRVVDGNRTLRVVTHDWQVDDDGDYAGVYEYDAVDYPTEPAITRVAYWSNRTVRASQFTTGGYNGTDYETSTTPSPVLDLDIDGTVVGILEAFEPRVAGRTAGRIVVVSTELQSNTLGTPRSATGTRNGTLFMRITPRGLVTDIRVTFETTLANRTVRVIRETRVRAVGATTVERPDWVATARAEEQRYDT